MSNYIYGDNEICLRNNADFGLSLQKMLCERNEVYINSTAAGQFAANCNPDYDEELKPICKKIETVINSKIIKYLTFTDGYATGKQTTSPHNFLLDNGKTLSVRTNKTGDKVAPRTLGQAGAKVLTDFFSDIYGGPIISQNDVKLLIYHHIHEVFPYFAEYLFKSDYTVFINRQQPDSIQLIKADDLGQLSFDRNDFTFTRGIDTWNESTTLKYHNISVAEIQVHSNRFFKFRFFVSHLSEWMSQVKITNETLGMSAESAICKEFHLPRPESFNKRVSLYLEQLITPVIRDAFNKMPLPIKHTGSETGERGENSKCSYDFVLYGNQTLSLKTNKGKMVCPPEVGQPGSDTCLLYFSDYFPYGTKKVTNDLFKTMVYEHIEEIIPIYLAHLLDSNWLLWIYTEKGNFTYKIIESAKVSSFEWKREKLSFTKPTINDWNESNTVKYEGITIGEFQVHSGRSCFKFRFHMANLIALLDIN